VRPWRLGAVVVRSGGRDGEPGFRGKEQEKKKIEERRATA
jgi:hypothetical protein